MPIDARIPLMAGDSVLNLGDIMQKKQEQEFRQFQMDDIRGQREQAQQRNASLADLIRNRGKDGRIDPNSEAFGNYTDAAPQEALAMLDKLSAEEKAAAEAGVKDMAAAVKWAQTPEQWEQVKQSYRNKGMQVPDIPFEGREQLLIHFNQMSEYLEMSKQKIVPFEAGGGVASIDEYTGKVTPLIIPNDGSGQTGGNDIPTVTDAASYNALPPGAEYRTPDGNVRRKGGGGSNATGNFPGN
jgi:hypothetical protein